MAINSLSLGRDITLVIITQNGQINLDTVTSWTCKPSPDVRQSVAINGNVLYAAIPMGFKGTFTLDRTSPSLEQFWTQYESAYYAGQNLLASTITVTINEANGSVTQWQAEGVMFDAQDFGDWQGNDIVKQTLNFSASRYEQILS